MSKSSDKNELTAYAYITRNFMKEPTVQAS
ncbi:hypothetical protein SAMN05216209_4273 [Pseudomonas nitroreducens]|nr:hypothetical protein SAMN05216209_4273 [Pseudomonas nitroreducens]